MMDFIRPALRTQWMTTACWGNVCATCWRERVTLADVEAIVTLSDRLLERYGEGIGTMNLIEEGTRADDDARTAGSTRIRDLGPRLLCTTNIILGGGLWVAGARAITSTINLLSRRPLNSRITSSIEDAVTWQAPLLGRPDGQAVAVSDLHRFADRLLALFRGQLAPT
jgi:hypothetical protein